MRGSHARAAPPIGLDDSPSARRDALLEQVCSLVSADFCALFDVRRATDGDRYDTLSVAGDPDVGSFWTAQVPGALCVGPWDPRRPGRGGERFASGLEGGLEDRMLDGKIDGWNLYYLPIGLRWQRRLLVYDGAEFVGWLGLMRRSDTRDFDRRDDDALTLALPRLAAAVRGEARLRDLHAPTARASVITGEAGAIEMVTPGLQGWIDVHREALAALAPRALAGEAGSVLLGGATVSWTRLVTPGGALRALWMLDRAARPRRAALTERQVEVATYAAAGATLEEIARHAGISRETVKEHLKVVYRLLDVANRVELRDRLHANNN